MIARVVADRVDPGDVLVVEPRRGAPFLVEPLDDLGVDGLLGRQELQRDHPFEAGVLGAIDGPHARRRRCSRSSSKRSIRWPGFGRGVGPSTCPAARRDEEPPEITVAASRTAEPEPVADRLDPPGSVPSDRSALGSGSKSGIEWLNRDFGENSPQDFRVARQGRG